MLILKKLTKLIAILVWVFLFQTTTKVQAQITDLARVEFTYFPQTNSDNTFRRFRSFVNIPIPIGKSGYIVPGVEYRNINLKLRDPFPFPSADKERFQSVTFRLAYTNKMTEDWRYAFKAGVTLASDFKGPLMGDDYVYEGAAFLIKDKTGEDDGPRPWRIIFGITYSTTAGRPLPLPFVNYYQKFLPDWSFTIGIPKSNLKYHLSESHIVQAFITLDGFYANIQEDFSAGNNRLADSISMTTLLSGLGYEYCFTKNLVFYVYLGHTIINDIRLRDSEQKDVFTLNDSNTFYGRTGIKFKI